MENIRAAPSRLVWAIKSVLSPYVIFLSRPVSSEKDDKDIK
jgi:hypothetical protein